MGNLAYVGSLEKAEGVGGGRCTAALSNLVGDDVSQTLAIALVLTVLR
jgi:hypothetical protein